MEGFPQRIGSGPGDNPVPNGLLVRAEDQGSKKILLARVPRDYEILVEWKFGRYLKWEKFEFVELLDPDGKIFGFRASSETLKDFQVKLLEFFSGYTFRWQKREEAWPELNTP